MLIQGQHVRYAGNVSTWVPKIFDKPSKYRVSNGREQHGGIFHVRRLFEGLSTGLGTGRGNGKDQIRLFPHDLSADLTGRRHIGLGIVHAVINTYSFFFHVILKTFQNRIQGRVFHELTDGDLVSFGFNFSKW